MNRLEAFNIAATLVSPIVLEHGLEPYSVGGSVLFSGTNFTKVEQHVDQILRVADWLLEPSTET